MSREQYRIALVSMTDLTVLVVLQTLEAREGSVDSKPQVCGVPSAGDSCGSGRRTYSMYSIPKVEY